MPLPANSRASSIRKITEIVARFHAPAVDVCKNGDLVALHCSTAQGTVVVTMPLREFVEKCRGPRDHNRNPLPVYAELRAESPEMRAAEPGSMSDEQPAEPRSYRGRPLDPDRLAKYQAALADWRAGRVSTKRAAVVRHMAPELYPAFISWTKKPAQQEPLTDGDRAPVLKPGGKLL